MDHVPPHKRGVGYLFQDLALFPHLTVAANIGYSFEFRAIMGQLSRPGLKNLQRHFI